MHQSACLVCVLTHVSPHSILENTAISFTDTDLIHLKSFLGGLWTRRLHEFRVLIVSRILNHLSTPEGQRILPFLKVTQKRWEPIYVLERSSRKFNENWLCNKISLLLPSVCPSMKKMHSSLWKNGILWTADMVWNACFPIPLLSNIASLISKEDICSKSTPSPDNYKNKICNNSFAHKNNCLGLPAYF